MLANVGVESAAASRVGDAAGVRQSWRRRRSAEDVRVLGSWPAGRARLAGGRAEALGRRRDLRSSPSRPSSTAARTRMSATTAAGSRRRTQGMEAARRGRSGREDERTVGHLRALACRIRTSTARASTPPPCRGSLSPAQRPLHGERGESERAPCRPQLPARPCSPPKRREARRIRRGGAAAARGLAGGGAGAARTVAAAWVIPRRRGRASARRGATGAASRVFRRRRRLG